MTAIRRRDVMKGTIALIVCDRLAPFSLGQEPITTATAAVWVATQLAEGALQHVGGEILANALGEAKITDVRTWIVEAVTELESFISTQISDLVQNQMISDLQEIVDSLGHYASLTPSDQQNTVYLSYVTDSDKASSRLITESLLYDRAISIALAAMAYRLLALQTLYKLNGDAGNITFLQSTTDSFLIAIVPMRDRIAGKMGPDARLKMSCSEMTSQGPSRGQFRGPTHSYKNCDVSLDGKVINHYKSMDDGGQRATSEANAQMAAMSLKYQKDKDDFLQAVNGACSAIVNCVDKMFQQIGRHYAAPPNVVIGPSPNATAILRALSGKKLSGAEIRSPIAK